MSASYTEFVRRKLLKVPPTGMERVPALSGSLFPHQQDLTQWALRRGRAAIFADTGLGKTRIEIEWAKHVACATGGRVLILAPLAVSRQTVAEGETMGVRVVEVREQGDGQDARIHITNYERLHKFTTNDYAGVVLDESSIIKHHDAKTFSRLTDAFDRHAWRLCATATPAPNDYAELGTHAEFLGICSRAEMLSEYFVHDGGETQKWRLKGHARGAFWAWVASWGALVKRPSDLGHDDSGYNLPPLTVINHEVASPLEEVAAMGMLFAPVAAGLMERRQARSRSVGSRVAAVAEMVNASADPWVVWCELNSESEALTRAIPDAVEVRGSQSIDDKESRLASFASGASRVIVTKPSIAGFGLNWQHASHMAFVGVNDSWESYYQAVRRCWRFGQRSPVEVHVFASDAEGNVVANLQRKEEEARAMGEQLAAMTGASVRANVLGSIRDTNSYAPTSEMEIPAWLRQ